MTNKRRYKRLLNLENIISVRYRVPFAIRKKEALSVENISGGGIRLCLSEKLKAGTRIKMEIRLLGEKETLTARGEVAWSAESESYEYPKTCFDAGIKFLEIDPLSICKIYNYFQEHNLKINMA